MLVMFHMLLCLLCGCFWCCHSISCRCLTYEEGQYDAFDADSASIGRCRFRPDLSNFMLKFPDLKGSESVSSKSPLWFPHKRSLCGNLSLQERDQRELWHWLWRTWFIRPSARNCAVLKFCAKDQLDQSSVQQYWSCMWYDDVWCIIQRILHDVLYCRYCLSSNKW